MGAGHGDGGAVDDGFGSDVVVLGGVGDVESGTAFGAVEVFPDDAFVVVGQDPGVEGVQEFVCEGSVVVGVEGMEVELVALDDVGGVCVDEDVVFVVLNVVKEVEGVEFGDGDASGELCDAFDPADEALLVVAGVDEPFPGLFEASDGAGGEDSGAVGAVEEEGGEAERKIVVAGAVLKDFVLGVPLLDRDGSRVDTGDEFFGLCSDAAPEGCDAGVDVVDVDVGDVPFIKEAQGCAGASSEGLRVPSGDGLLDGEELGEEGREAHFAAGVAQGR